MKMLEIFQSGGPVMYPLLLCSITVLFVVVERSIFWIGLETRRDRRLLDEAMEIAQRGDWQLLKERVAGCRDYLIRILVIGILHREYSMGRAMESAAAEELRRMQRFMGVLDTMITVAPLFGIFGTVLGIIESFKVLGAAGIADPGAVSGGIAQALITTAAGLGIAILTVFPFNYFNSRVEEAAHQIEQYATSLEIVYEKLQDREKGETA